MKNSILINYFLIVYSKVKNLKSILVNSRFCELNKDIIEQEEEVEIDEQIAAVIPKVAENLAEIRFWFY